MRRSLLTFALAAAVPALAQTDLSKVEIKVHKVAGNVYMLEGAGGNIGVSIGDDGVLLVDDQYAPLVPRIKQALAGISNRPVKFVLNTHHHRDHTGGNEAFGETAPIIAHTNVRKRLQSGETAARPRALPVITFDDRLVVHINGEDIRAIHFPRGHTDGDVVIFFTRSNVVHMGDDYFNGLLPFIDLDSGGSVAGLIRNVEKVLAELSEDVRIIPGHGPLASKADLRAFVALLRDSSNIVEAGIRAGKSADQLKADKVLAKYESWSWRAISTDAFIDTLYTELSSTRTKR